ncbi:MAG TPA: cobaltochelatase subunit CobN [Leptolyngbyaceae cyanobacterium]
MHRLAATPGGWTPDTEGVIFVEQSPAPLVFLTSADTEIQGLANVLPHLPGSFPALRVTNLLQLQQQLTIDTYAEDVLQHAQIIILRLLGGRAYWSYGLEVVKETVAKSGTALIVLPGDDRPDPELMSHSTVSLQVANQLWRYLNEGGVENLRHGLMAICDRILNTQFNPPAPVSVPKVGVFEWKRENGRQKAESPFGSPSLPKTGILFYRAHYLSGNTAPIEALCEALEERGVRPVPVFVSSLQDPEVQADLLALLQPKEEAGINILLNTTSFSVAKLDGATPRLDLWQALDLPVLQVILSGGTYEFWTQQPIGLSSRDIAMNVALPEVDGRIITRAVSFKAVNQRSEGLETDVVTYAPVADRIAFVADLAARWVALRQAPVAERRVALILANYPTRDGRLANGVGLDTPQSCIEILKALKAAGYHMGDGNLPDSGDELIQWLTTGITNDPESKEFRATWQTLSLETYQQYFAALPNTVQTGVCQRWGPANEASSASGQERSSPPTPCFAIPGIQFGNIFVGIQPSRGYDLDPSLNYHAPDLEPTHDYLAFYFWLRHQFQAQAIIHVGKHGNLEWLPGKSIALSESCYSEAAFGPMPHLYPFIVNDPGEGAQAKRRAQAVIIDHLTPPMTRAELYGPLQQLEALVDEYYEAQSLDPTRLGAICDRILTLLKTSNLLEELALRKSDLKIQKTDLSRLLPDIDTYLCELKEAQIRDGLHIFGQCPQGRQLRDLIVAIARHPGPGRIGLTRAIAKDWGLDVDPLTDDPAQTSDFDGTGKWRNVGDVIEALEDEAARLVEAAIVEPQVKKAIAASGPLKNAKDAALGATPAPPNDSSLTSELQWIQTTLLPNLQQTPQELTNLLRGLEGRYVPSGPSGAPTRNRPDVLPTGRNFFSVDIRAIPTESAWDVGRKAAETLIERYVQENGEYPQTLGLSIWGTSTMRTGGDDLAEALALMGVRPVWDGPSRRVVDFEILPLSGLGRPRVDVTLRISGFFRDAFPNLIDLFDQAVAAVADLEESPEQNPLAARVRQEIGEWQAQGLDEEQAKVRSHYRIFGSKPGAYGAGLQGLIEAQNWTDDSDLARAYINWSSYAYGRGAEGHAAPEAFESRLRQLQVVLHNQDNREHDLLDSDDYYQFQGGLTAAVRSVQGHNPQTYFGDHALPENPKVRSLKEEIARVYRSRVVNPKWIEGVMRHGYKGAFEMAATVDYLFAYDATARCVEDYMYQGVAEAYVLDEQVQQFVQQSNPWALRDMAERLLEAHQRGLWQQPQQETLDQLRNITHEAEGILESRQLGPTSTM